MTLHAAELTAKINYEMTDTSKEVLRNEIIKILHEPDVLKTLIRELEKQIRIQTGVREQ